MKHLFCIMYLCLFVISPCLGGNKPYSLWYDRPAFNRGADFNVTVARGFPYDEDWERWSLPIGNGYMGAAYSEERMWSVYSFPKRPWQTRAVYAG